MYFNDAGKSVKTKASQMCFPEDLERDMRFECSGL